MVSVGDIFGVIDMIGAPSLQHEEFTAAMRAAFCVVTQASADELDATVTTGAAIDGLREAIRTGIWGLSGDHNEAFTITDDTREIIDTHVGIEDPNTADYYTYNETGDVIDGLVGFDNWLQTNHETHRQRLIDDGGDPKAIDALLNNLRLVEIGTGSDFYLTVAHPNKQIDTLIAALNNIGIESRRATTDPWPGAKPYERYNVFLHAKNHLINHHGYVPLKELSDSTVDWIIRVVDEQNSIIADIEHTHGGSTAHLRFMIARRDINELSAEFLDLANADPYSWSVKETSDAPFLNRPPSDWDQSRTPPATVIAYLDEWAPKVEQQAATLEYISDYLAQTPTQGDDVDQAQLRSAIFDRMLNGWKAETDDQLLTSRLRYAEFFDPGVPKRERVIAEVQRVSAWIKANPNGRR